MIDKIKHIYDIICIEVFKCLSYAESKLLTPMSPKKTNQGGRSGSCSGSIVSKDTETKRSDL